MTAATPLYRSIMLEIERQRVALGLSMWQVDDLACTQDGYYAKALHPDTPSGRQAHWYCLHLIVSALFPDGFDCEIRVKKGPLLTALSMKQKIKSAAACAAQERRPQRDYMTILSGLAAIARKEKIKPGKRRSIARHASRTRWRRQRLKVNGGNNAAEKQKAPESGGAGQAAPKAEKHKV